MNVVGMVGSIISQGMYSVATPFHPFGGAVDVIVVEQQDGTYRSTPWYVRFGKFQGVLKGAEKIVTISVNGIEANFQMYLDSSGQAYFMREVVSGGNEGEVDAPATGEPGPMESSQGECIGIGKDDRQDSYDEDKGQGDNRFQDGQASLENQAGSSSIDSWNLEEVEDLVKQSDDSSSEMVLISVDGHVLTAPFSSTEANTENVQLSTPQFHLGPGDSSSGGFCRSAVGWEVGLFDDLDASAEKGTPSFQDQSEGTKDHREASTDYERNQGTGDGGAKPEDSGTGLGKNDTFNSCLDLVSQIVDGDIEDVGSHSTRSYQRRNSEPSAGVSSLSEKSLQGAIAIADSDSSQYKSVDSDSSQNHQGEMDGSKLTACVDVGHEVDVSIACLITEKTDLSCGPGSPKAEASGIEIGESCELSLPSGSNDKDSSKSIPKISAVEEEHNEARIHSSTGASGLGFEISLCGNLLRPRMGLQSAEEVFEGHRISEEEFKSSGPSIVKNSSLIVKFEDRYYPWGKVAHVILGKVVFDPNFSMEAKGAIPVEHEETASMREEALEMSPSFSRRWRLWPIPFRRSSSLQRSNSSSSTEELFVDSESTLSPTAEQTAGSKKIQSPRKQFVQTNLPTNEQIASLNLKEGQNKIAFSFCTRVLGKQQVDANIYLWKWNARIVISDVDGTITKSDVLGQFMPLVGKDWTQSGVARLFSAIKENGYQLLFLSARAIVQAYLTRSFLLNLKQDGKALPTGPVVISPDGLFPSLFREVIRRAPHEFKIACLEDIRALFPSDYNPFYAGFGNRDTDELSYRKIGIPKGKIFIINPKGEVAINHCIDVKSYTSLHTLVNDMFPPTSLVEQEDFNSWNYWKMPLPDIDV